MPQPEKYAHIQYSKGRMVSIDRLRYEIRGMTRKTLLYKALKEELSALGYWKMRDRGISVEKMATIKASKQYGSIEGEW